MKKNLTELVFILDKSGSMAGLESDTIGGFTAMIEKQKKEDGQALVTTYFFDHTVQMVHDRVDIQDLDKEAIKKYHASGSTALIDAIGTGVDHIAKIHKYIRKEDRPENTVFVITTDGEENSSRKYDSAKVKKLIEEKKKDGWQFIFLGANIDAVETSKAFGIDPEFTVDYRNDSRGIDLNYEAMSSFISKTRQGKALDKTWKEEIKKRED